MMTMGGRKLFRLPLLLLLLVVAATAAMTSMPNCTSRCGSVDVPFPFGIEPGCFLEGFHLFCNTSESKLFSGNIEFIGIDVPNGQASVYKRMAWDCYENSVPTSSESPPMNLAGSPYMLSSARNKFTAIGCDTIALFVGNRDQSYSSTGCVSLCNDNTTFSNGSCSGAGCCQTAIPPGINYFNMTLYSFSGHKDSSWHNPCSFSFLVDESQYSFSTSDLYGTAFFDRNDGRVPIVLDWSIGHVGCQEAMRNATSYACLSQNSVCLDSVNGPGYLCNCSRGYQGSPYLKDGCQDIDECANPETYPCYGVCNNLPGNYECRCPYGTSGNPFVPSRCNVIAYNSSSRTSIIISASVGGSILLLLAAAALWRILKQINMQRRKDECYRRNLDLLRNQQSSNSDLALIERMKIYELDELEKATNNFDRARIVGGGGHGHVYKGILSDQHVVAIKKPMIANQSELGQFINEVFILSQTNHRNVVKFFGCCLQTEVPLLVFEFISGGTLSDHLVNGERFPPFSFEDRLRIATEVARALSYLHSAASITIFHRDIKSSNILLDERNTAKLGDFGASRSVSFEQTSITTAVQGTYGYLDPEYHQTGRLTEKSDVYSFGVILAELLTGRIAIPYQRNNVVRHLVMDFLVSLKEDSLYKILDPVILKEGRQEAVERVARLAGMCLKLSGDERPTMKEVEDELEAMRSKKLRGTDDNSSRRRSLEKQLDASKLKDNSRYFTDNGRNFTDSGVASNIGSSTSSEANWGRSTREYSREMELNLFGEWPR